ncbi:MAG: hypothetical protein V1779_17675 [bacterium]
MANNELQKLALNMVKLETNLKNLTTDVGEIKTTLKEFIEKADERYAEKRVEKLVYGAIGLLLVEVFGAIVYLVIN